MSAFHVEAGKQAKLEYQANKVPDFMTNNFDTVKIYRRFTQEFIQLFLQLALNTVIIVSLLLQDRKREINLP